VVREKYGAVAVGLKVDANVEHLRGVVHVLNARFGTDDRDALGSAKGITSGGQSLCVSCSARSHPAVRSQAYQSLLDERGRVAVGVRCLHDAHGQRQLRLPRERAH